MAKTNPEVLHCEQPQSQLCWATCILMVREVILKKRNFDITPGKVYESIAYGAGNTPARDTMIVAALHRWGVEAQLVEGGVGFARVCEEIDGDHPLILGYKGSPGRSGHVVVVGGYEFRGPTRWLNIYDPAGGGVENVPFRSLEGGERQWDATFILRERQVNV